MLWLQSVRIGIDADPFNKYIRELAPQIGKILQRILEKRRVVWLPSPGSHGFRCSDIGHCAAGTGCGCASTNDEGSSWRLFLFGRLTYDFPSNCIRRPAKKEKARAALSN